MFILLILTSSLFCYRDSAEQQTTCFTDWRQKTHDTGPETLLAAPQVDTADPEPRGGEPNLIKRDEGELTAPVKGEETPAQGRQQPVKTKLATRKAAVTALPGAV
jgi:hypothetical protein